MTSRCELCGVEIEDGCDVCERHAMNNEQAAEMMRRAHKAMNEYRLELWPELAPESTEQG